jgi:NAD(P)-dependent dehydrogenase (short-subunit alcohol dehydrogenase family)
MLPPMKERVSVITGGRRGLGFAASEKLARMGYQVVLTARDQAGADAAASKLSAEGLAVRARTLDVASDESDEQFFDWLDGEYGRLDVLVNNAGTIFENTKAGEGFEPPAVFKVKTAVLKRAFDNNALGAYRTLQRALPVMNANGYGRVVNVSSGAGGLTEMNGGVPAYRLSKVAMNAVTRVFHAAAGENVKVNSVCPGWVRTDMGGPEATRGVDEGVSGIIWAATLPSDGPSGGFFRDGKPIAW